MKVVATRNIAFTVAALLALAPVAPSGAAWGHADRITFSQEVALPGVVLPAGSYTFEIANPTSVSRVVRVSHRETRRVYFAGLTTPVERLTLGPQVVILEDVPAGEPIAIMDWYPAGGTTGQRFTYR